MRRPGLLAAALAAAAIAVAAIALVRDSGDSGLGAPAGFSGSPEGRKPLIFDIGAMAYDPNTRGPALAEIRSLGADAVRVLVSWNLVAPKERPAGFRPTDPADGNYNWSVYDETLREAERNGLKIMLMAAGPAPLWAADDHLGVVDPDPEQFGAFASAMAKRYGGGFDPDGGGGQGPLPKVDLWTVWNEPNLSTFLQPQYRAGRPYSPLLYRRLYLAGQEAIHEQDPSAPIVIGETAPTGGLESVDPITFTREALCLDQDFEQRRNCPRADEEIDAAGWSTHPYPLAGRPPFRAVTNPNYVTMTSLGSLETTLDRAAAAGAIDSDLPIYITEFGIQSFPDPNAVSLEAQAAFIGIAEQIAYAEPRVVTFAQYLMRDDGPISPSGVRYGNFESGLRFFAGTKKPSYESMRLPLSVQKLGGKVSVWGIVQPHTGPSTVKVRYKDPGRPARTLQSVTTDDLGIYTTTYGDFRGREWQAVWRSPVDGRVYSSPWIRSYAFAQPG